MADIFISYARHDQDRVRPLADALEQRGWTVWWDRTMQPGQEFDQVIQQALDDARCVIVVWTDTSIDSRWVREEADDGLQRNILVPVMLDQVVIPLGFRRLHAADLVGWPDDHANDQFQELLNSVSEMIGSGEAMPSASLPPTDVPSTQHAVALEPAGPGTKAAISTKWRYAITASLLVVIVAGVGAAYTYWPRRAAAPAPGSSLLGMFVHGTARTSGLPFTIALGGNGKAEMELTINERGVTHIDHGRWWVPGEKRICFQFGRFGKGRELCRQTVEQDGKLIAIARDGGDAGWRIDAKPDRVVAALKPGVLDEPDIRRLLIGNTIAFEAPRSSRSIRLYFAPDGKVISRFAEPGARLVFRSWEIRDAGVLCRTVGPSGEDHCVRVESVAEPNTVVLFNNKVRYVAKILAGKQLDIE